MLSNPFFLPHTDESRNRKTNSFTKQEPIPKFPQKLGAIKNVKTSTT